jgi:hypothetical protein
VLTKEQSKRTMEIRNNYLWKLNTILFYFLFCVLQEIDVIFVLVFVL